MTLGALVCGKPGIPCTATTTLNHLSTSIDRFSSRAIEYLNTPFCEEAQTFGAFCTRVTLENACAALVGRLDSFRMLYLAEFQSQGSFEYGKPTKSGFRWTGDVIADDKPGLTLWSSDQDPNKVSRALFSPHVEFVHWRPAFEAAVDFIDEIGVDGFGDIKLLDSSSFIAIMKGRCGPLYSTLSKGVHWDFFVSTIVMDEGTLKDAIRDCLSIVSNLAFVSHFVPTAFGALSNIDAVDAYRKVQEAIQ